MLTLDILGTLITLLLMDIFNWKKVFTAVLVMSLITLLITLFLEIEFSLFNIGGIFSYVETNGGIHWFINLVPFFTGIILAQSIDRENFDVRILIPWQYKNTWNAVFYKLGFYSLFYQITKIMLRG